MASGIRGRVAALLLVAALLACVRDDWKYIPRLDAGFSDALLDAPVEEGAPVITPDPGCTLAAPNRCGEACVDLQTSLIHCGGCGQACSGIERCAAGVCGQRSCAVQGTPGCSLIAIEGGASFTMGSSAFSPFYGGNPEQPNITVGRFALDAYEVTVARFNVFWAVRTRDLAAVRATPIAYPNGHSIAWGPAPPTPSLQSYLFNWLPRSTNRDAHPMNGVSYWLAQEFCVWDGGRLPTEAEWEYAARGRPVPSEFLRSGRLYPWGDTPPNVLCDRAHWRSCGGSDSGATLPVGSIPAGLSGGLHDLAGNVYEWTADTFETYRPSWTSNVDPLSDNPAVGERVIRGGSWGDSNPNGLLALARFSASPLATDNPFIGFRCARPLP